MLGNPKYKKGDIVKFDIIPYGSDELVECEGTVEIIDRWGTFEQNEEVSYDVMVENFCGEGHRTLVKHIRESRIK